MDVQAKDVIDCTRNQRNAALDEATQLAAEVLALRRRVAELESQVSELTPKPKKKAK